jgi:hypothetical protein
MSEELPQVEWTRDKLKRFKKAYQRATQDGREVFEFEGHEFIPGYAKYLIEYLEGVLS